ncbi:MAG: serine--tRNA ligase [Thermoleophilaceae bacterium]
MLDPNLIRGDPTGVREALARRGATPELERWLEADARRRELLPALEGARAEQNAASERIGEEKRAGGDAAAAIAAMRDVAPRVKAMEAELADVEAVRDAAMAALPNLPDASAPAEERVLREVGASGATGADHLELLDGLVDMEAGARLAGSRFAYLKGPLVLLELALVRWALELLGGHGFEPVVPPVLVRERALFGTGFLPDTEQQIYRLPEDDLYLAGTSEVALASLHADEILEADALPLRYAGFSSCFRREAGAAGRDTRGIFRVHQFDKVEMFSFVEAATAAAEHERILAIEEEIMAALEIPYRVVSIAVDDLGASAAKKYDVEAWLPGQGAYRELTSCSNTTDFQARRLGVRHRDTAGGRPAFVHTLNGTAVAVGRTIIALVETHQQRDGSVSVPAMLREYGAPETIAAPSA